MSLSSHPQPLCGHALLLLTQPPCLPSPSHAQLSSTYTGVPYNESPGLFLLSVSTHPSSSHRVTQACLDHLQGPGQQMFPGLISAEAEPGAQTLKEQANRPLRPQLHVRPTWRCSRGPDTWCWGHRRWLLTREVRGRWLPSIRGLH